jgi:hypothetical protein
MTSRELYSPAWQKYQHKNVTDEELADLFMKKHGHLFKMMAPDKTPVIIFSNHHVPESAFRKRYGKPRPCFWDENNHRYNFQVYSFVGVSISSVTGFYVPLNRLAGIVRIIMSEVRAKGELIPTQ